MIGRIASASIPSSRPASATIDSTIACRRSTNLISIVCLDLESDILNRLLAIDESSLTASDRVNLHILKRQKEEAIAEIEFRDYLIPITSRSGFHISFPDLASRLHLRTLLDFENFISRLENFREWARQHVELMRTGIAEGMVLPTIVLEGYEDAIVPHIVDDPRDSLLFEPFTSLPEDVPTSEHQRLVTAASAASRDSVVPGFREFLAFMRDEYYPATPVTPSRVRRSRTEKPSTNTSCGCTRPST